MTLNYRRLFVFSAGLFWVLMAGFSTVGAETAQKKSNANQGPMVINSKTLEADDRNRQVVFSGDVEAKRDDFTVFCQKLVVLYKKDEEKKKDGGVSARIDKIIATGHVKIIRSEGGVATGEKAVFYQNDEKLVLTGKPMVKQGGDFVEGDVITLFLKEDRSIVESARDKKVKAVIFPKQKERQKP